MTLAPLAITREVGELLYLLALLLLTATHTRGQQTIVTATVVDPRGFAYQAGTGLASIQCPGNSQPYHNRSPLTRTITFPGLSGTGSFTQSLWDTSQITDVNNAYIERREMTWDVLDGWWSDAGTFESLLHASNLVAKTGANNVNMKHANSG